MAFPRQEMDVESLEAANQSLQTDLKLAFKRIGDLQAALEDEMESDDNDDLVNWCAADRGGVVGIQTPWLLCGGRDESPAPPLSHAANCLFYFSSSSWCLLSYSVVLFLSSWPACRTW